MVMDTTAPAGKAAVAGLYRRTAVTVVSTLGGGDVFLAYPVTSNTQASGFEGAAVSVPAYDPLSTNEDEYQAALASARSRATGSVASAMSDGDGAQGTDLFDGLGRAASFLNGPRYRAASEKVLVFCTDGLQQGGGFDLSSDDLSDRAIASIVGRLRSAGKLPDLRGVDAWVVGVGADDRRIEANRITQLRRFWTAYLVASGARVSADRVAPDLENFSG